ncbi:Creatinase/Aminopeptidase P/Spt16, N-terminal [Sesbania bispinosa]|nr:Creatinase/Aminopeptidase P/Spt16, N-terminal [Sesbania bispinosa]
MRLRNYRPSNSKRIQDFKKVSLIAENLAEVFSSATERPLLHPIYIVAPSSALLSATERPPPLVSILHKDSFFITDICKGSATKLEWKPSPGPFHFGSLKSIQVQHQSPMAVWAPSNDVAPASDENQNQEGGERIRFLKDECSPPCVLRAFDVMSERIEQKMVDSLPALRSLMASHSPPLNALVVPSEDYHRSKYVSDRNKRCKFIFTAPDEVAWLYNIREAVDLMLVKDDFGSAGCHVIVEEYPEGEKGDPRVGFTHDVVNMDDMSNLGLTILASGGTALSVLFVYSLD